MSIDNTPAEHDAQAPTIPDWLRNLCQFISDTLASGNPAERRIAREVMAIVPLSDLVFPEAAGVPTMEPEAQAVGADGMQRPYSDLRNAKWLHPECYAAGACQSLLDAFTVRAGCPHGHDRCGFDSTAQQCVAADCPGKNPEQARTAAEVAAAFVAGMPQPLRLTASMNGLPTFSLWQRWQGRHL